MNEKSSRTGLEIAVIGMAGRFPGAKNISEFWENLKNGVESIAYFSDEELESEGVEAEELQNPNLVKAKGIVEDQEYFDESFFNFTPIEAQIIDPQMRVFLETSWEALEHAGYAGANYKGRIGVYGGTNTNIHWNALILFRETQLGFLKGILSCKDYLSMLTSYKLDLRGPSMSVFTACSTSLVTIDLALRALLTGECDMALAGGVTLSLPKKQGYHYQEGIMFSKDGHCRTFDANASGTNFGQGAGVVVLKPLEQAIADRDVIWAVIKGSAVSNDGIEKVGVTAPTVKGQAAAARAALHLAEVEPESISYLEAHGTATVLGDPIEIEGLTQAFQTQKKGFCRIGSVKTNVGHLDCAAGITGFIKTVLAIKHRLIPPSLNYESPNPKIDFENSPFVVNTQLSQWKNDKYPLRAGVNSLGIGGTNAHVILEEAPEIQVSTEGAPWKLILFSAKTASALEKVSENFSGYLRENPGINLADTAYTLQVGKNVFDYKQMLVCSTVDEAIETLTEANPKKVRTAYSKHENRPVVFLFPGQGSQYLDMGLGLYRTQPFFRREIDHCFEILQGLMEDNIKEILYPPEKRENDSSRLNQTHITQPLLFAFEYALAKLLMEWGISPYAMIGHSIGEYVAACLSGVFSLEDGLALVALRGKLMQEMPGGSMLSVSLPEAELTPLLTADISMAAVNGPSLCVVSGPLKAIETFAKQLEENGTRTRALHTSHAFHSKMMEPILERFTTKLRTITLNPPGIPYISNLTGNWITVEDATDPGYWASHIRFPVQFANGLTELLKEENTIFIEVGPGRTLSTFITKHQDKLKSHSTLNLVRHPKENMADDEYLLVKIGQLWLWGQKIDWAAFYREEKRSRLPLPTYPFEKNRFWFDENPFKIAREKFSQNELRKIPDIRQWFYIPSWQSSILPVRTEDFEFSCCLLFADEFGIAPELTTQLEQFGNDVIFVTKGDTYSSKGVREFFINPANADDYHQLFQHLKKEGRMPATVAHLWSVTGHEPADSDKKWDRVENLQNLGYYSLLYMMQAIGNVDYNAAMNIIVISDNMHDVLGENRVNPGKATLIGPVRTIPKEYPNVNCRSVDIVLPEPGSQAKEKLIRQLYEEITIDGGDDFIALRKNIRWVQNYRQVQWDKADDVPRLKDEGVYLITGGLGGIGLVLAAYIAQQVKAKLVLLGRSPLPDREQWEEWLNTHNSEDTISGKIKKVMELEEMGAEVMTASADVADQQQMQEVIARALEQFGSIDGVIHAAGIIDYGGVIQRRTADASERVFESKIKGTLVLDHVLKDVKPDFFLLCSSLNSILGPFGEVAYTSANAFLDAFALDENENRHTYKASILWDLWLEVGVIVEIIKRAAPTAAPKLQTKEVTHPLFDKYSVTSGGDGIFDTKFNVDTHWVLNEHKVMENPVLVGTAYLEMARAAFENHTSTGTAEIRNVYFLNPLVMSGNRDMETRLILKKHDDYFEFFMISRPGTGKGKLRPYARGEMAVLEAEPPQIYNIEEIKAACSKEEINNLKEEFKPFEGFVGTSQRWNCLQRMFVGDNQALAELELAPEYREDIPHYGLHPSIMDIATAFPMGLIMKKNNYLPLSYKKLKVMGPLTEKIFSYARKFDDDSSQKDIISYNISIFDEQGTQLVEIEEFNLLAISGEGQEIANDLRNKYPLASFLASFGPEVTGDDDPMKAKLKLADISGITPEEGVDVFHRILGGTMPQVVISTQDLMGAIQKSKLAPQQKQEETLKGGGSRPELNTPYVAPRNETEEALSTIFSTHLGIKEIGVHDDFFELGLESLKAVDITASIEQELNIKIALGDIFNYPSIEDIAKHIENIATGNDGIPIEAGDKTNKTTGNDVIPIEAEDKTNTTDQYEQ
jgi:acyl transferase domain-containing protein/acyl carrier protein